MTRSVLLALATAMTVNGCGNNNPVPNFNIGGAEDVAAGAAISVYVVWSDVGGDQAKLTFAWSVGSDLCNVVLESPGERRTKVQIPADCPSGKLQLEVLITTPEGKSFALVESIRVTAPPKPSPSASAPAPVPVSSVTPDAIRILIPDEVSGTSTSPAGSSNSDIAMSKEIDNSYKIKLDAARIKSGPAAACWELSREVTVTADQVLQFSIRAHHSGEYLFMFDRKGGGGVTKALKRSLTEAPEWADLVIVAADLPKGVESALGRICIGVEGGDERSSISLDLQKVLLLPIVKPVRRPRQVGPRPGRPAGSMLDLPDPPSCWAKANGCDRDAGAER